MYFANLKWAFMSAFQKELWKIPFHQGITTIKEKIQEMTLELTFEMEQKPVELKFFFRHLKEVQQYLGNQTERTQVRLKGWRHLQDCAITNSLSIFYEIVLKNGAVSSVTLDGQKQDLALLLTLLVPKPSRAWIFLGLPSLFLLCSHFVQSLTADLLSLNPSCC